MLKGERRRRKYPKRLPERNEVTLFVGQNGLALAVYRSTTDERAKNNSRKQRHTNNTKLYKGGVAKATLELDRRLTLRVECAYLYTRQSSLFYHHHHAPLLAVPLATWTCKMDGRGEKVSNFNLLSLLIHQMQPGSRENWRKIGNKFVLKTLQFTNY